MVLSQLLLIAGGVCFVLEAIGLQAVVKWWALGVAFWFFAQVA